MKAIVKISRKYGGIKIKEIPEPDICDDKDVIVEVKSAAICGSDIHAYEYQSTYEFIKIPVVMGHEFSGIVRKIGTKVSKFKLGDRVMGESVKYCGSCNNCRNGKTNICHYLKLRGLHIDGCMSQFKKMHEKYLHQLPENLSFSEGAAAQACTVSTHALIYKTRLLPGDNVVVFGPGIVGQSAAQLAKMRGASKVFLIGTNVDEGLRLKMGRQSGFYAVNVEKQDLQKELLKFCKTDKVDVVIESSGSARALHDSIEILKQGGHLTIVGIYSKPIEIDISKMVRSEFMVSMSYSSVWDDYERTLKFLSEGILCIHPFLKEYPYYLAESAFEDALSRRVVKPVLIF